MGGVGSSIRTSLALESPGCGRIGHRLALAARHFLDQIAWSRFGFQFIEQFSRAVDHRLLVEHPKGQNPLSARAQEHVLARGGEIVGQREILIDDFDTLGARLNGLMEMADLAVDENFPVPLAENSGNQLDQGGLAGTLSPINPTTSPGSIDQLMSFTAWMAPKLLDTLRTSSRATPVTSPVMQLFRLPAVRYSIIAGVAPGTSAAMVAAPTLSLATSANLDDRTAISIIF